MDFLGSKKRLLNWINEFTIGNTFLDGCSGSGIVTQFMCSHNKTVYSCDLMYCPETIIKGTIGLTEDQLTEAEKFINWANAKIKGIEGFFYKNYTGERTYFIPENAAFLDQYRLEVENIKDETVKNYVLYCGMEALSRACNTCGLQACFLKKFKRPAREKIVVRMEKHYPGKKPTHYRGNVLDLLPTIEVDTFYLDPPYTERQYEKCYHIYETFIRNDNPEIFGKTGQRKTMSDPSEFCKIYTFEDMFKKTIAAARAKRIIISYNSEGNMKKERFVELFNCKVYEMEFRRYKSRNSKKGQLIEYLFIIDN